MTQALILRALGESQVRVVAGKKVVVEMASTADSVRAIQRLCRRAADGKDLLAFIRFLDLTDKAFRNGNSKNGHGPDGTGPIAPNFIRPQPQPEHPGGEDPGPDTGLTHNGEEYA